MKIHVTFPGDLVEFDTEDLNTLVNLLERAVPLRDSGYGYSKEYKPDDKAITITFPVKKVVEPKPVELAPEPAPGTIVRNIPNIDFDTNEV